jgi:hypothetical protein
METLKKCTQCKIQKPLTDFAKHRGTKDQLQYRCKECSKLNSKYFRDVLRPDYYWGEGEGYFVKNREKTNLYNKDYFCANKSAKIYRIDLPEGTYIGATKRHLHTRLTQHINDFKKVIRDGRGVSYLPLLHNALANYELSDIKKMVRTGYIIEQFNANSTEMKQREKEWIIKLSGEGIKLLNISGNPLEKNTKSFG